MKRIATIAIFIAISAAIGFGAVRALEPDDTAVVAQQPGPSDESELPADVQERIDDINEDASKERFTGEINGITFTENPLAPPDICKNGRVEAEVGPEETAKSDLDFSPSYLPADLKLVYEAGSACQGQVISVVKNYMKEGGSEVIVAMHLLNDPIVTSDAPGERLEEASINGNPAVFQNPVYPGGKTAIYLRDGETFWIVWGQFLDSGEVVKFVEGLD